MMRFDLPKDHSSIIKVIGVGGGGSNAVNYMFQQGIKGVDFIVCNTDNQALDKSDVPLKVQLGATLTEGRGAGSIPEVGKNAAVETLDEVKTLLGNNTTMVFVTAGMGGGTGTGAAPIIAKAAREMGVLTVGIVTIPFMFEGRKRMQQADIGLKEMRDAVDTLLVIKNDKLRELYGNLSLKQAFGHADEVLCTAAKGIAEVITLTGEINVDMNDVNTVMRNSGVAIMGSGRASGEGRAIQAVTDALESPLLNDNDIEGANFVLLNITYGSDEILMDEIMEITDHIQDQAGMSAEVIWGYGPDESLGDEICVTVIATGFNPHAVDAGLPKVQPQKNKYQLNTDELKEVTTKVEKPTQVIPSTPLSNEPATFEKEEEAEPFLVKKVAPEPQEDVTEESTPTLDRLSFTTAPSEPAEPQSETQEMVNDDVLFTPQEPEMEPSSNVDLFSQEENTEEVTPQPSIEQPTVEESAHRYNLFEDELDTQETPPTDSLKITETSAESFTTERPSREELISKNKNREAQVRELTHKLKTPSGLADLESEPAYKRKNVILDDVPHSSDSSASRYTLTEETDENGNKQVKLKDNNSFLHDNVD